MLAQRVVRLAVPTHLLRLPALLDARHLHLLLFQTVLAMDGKEVLVEADVLGIGRRKTTLAKREIVDSIQRIRLAHPIIAHQAIDIGAEVCLQLSVGFEVGEL